MRSHTAATRLALIGGSLAAILLSGCAAGDDGPKATEDRTVAEFARVSTDGPADVRIRIGQPQRVRVVAGEKVIDDVHTDVRDGVLEVSFDRHRSGEVVVEVDVPSLTAIDTDGSGDVIADGVDSDALDVRMDGSGDLDVTGTVERIAVDQQGSGDLDLQHLSAREARATLKGSGDAEFWVEDHFDVRADGSGDVHYRGDATVTKQLEGSGDFDHRS